MGIMSRHVKWSWLPSSLATECQWITSRAVTEADQPRNVFVPERATKPSALTEHARTMNMVTRGPFGLDSSRGRTLAHERTVLVVVHTVTAGTRLGDVVPMLEADPRIQVVYTHPPAALLSGGTHEFLTRLGGLTIPWRTATVYPFDLAIAAHAGLLEWIHAPVACIPHGNGYSKYQARWDMDGPQASRGSGGPDRARLLYHGRVIASAHLMPTTEQARQLLRACPEASDVTVVTGDPCFDRLEVSLPHRASYRDVLATGDRTLVTVTSTWGHGALLADHPGMIAELIGQLPADKYQVAAIVHGNVWHWNGRRQLISWYSACIRQGLMLIPPEEGWRATIAASDVVIGDLGSVTPYAAAAGIPVVLGTYPAAEVVPGSLVARLAEVAPRLEHDAPYAPQLSDGLAAWTPERHAWLRSLVTDRPGQAASTIRTRLYQLLKLSEPADPPLCEPVPAPRPVTLPRTFGGGW